MAKASDFDLDRTGPDMPFTRSKWKPAILCPDRLDRQRFSQERRDLLEKLFEAVAWVGIE